MPKTKRLSSRRSGREIRQRNSVHSFPVVGRHHFDRIPWTTIEERSIRPLTDTFLAADAEVRINFDATEWRMIFVGYPEHASFDRTVFDASRRARATRTTVG